MINAIPKDLAMNNTRRVKIVKIDQSINHSNIDLIMIFFPSYLPTLL